MGSVLTDLGLTVPVLAAPMAGGPSTPALVTAAARAGSLGFLPAGYQTAQAFAEQIGVVRHEGVVFGVNLFAPNPVPVDVAAFRRYAAEIQPEADAYGIDLTGSEPVEDDDSWRDKLDVLLGEPVPVVSFTFGIPEPAVIAALRRAGSIVIQTVTSAGEALAAADAGVVAIAVQGSAAGGHSGTLTPERPPAPTPTVELVAQVRQAVTLPLIAAGGLATPGQVGAVLRAGAEAAMVGTALLRTPESGASAAHRAALADPLRGETVITRAFTGRPARALPNRFVERHDATAPLGYPAVHHLTSALRRAAVAAGDSERFNMWAGAGYRYTTTDPAGQVLVRLAADAR
jgi:nitronate monooxygenase